MAPLVPRGNNFHGRGVNLAIISIVFTTVAVGLIGPRLASRSIHGRSLGLDDYAIIVSAVFSIGLTASNCVAVEYGYGKSLTILDSTDLHKALQAFWAAQIFYKFTINLTKTSICLLYLRIFPCLRFKRIVYAMLAVVNLNAFAGIMATVFQCTPIYHAWNKEVEGSCINLTAFWYANAAVNILSDCAILALPMPEIKQLNLPQRQKWGLYLVFALGGFVCITSILRMTTLKTGAQAVDMTYGTLNSTIWTTVESNTAIICACLPMLKGPLAALFPKMFPRGTLMSRQSFPGLAQRRKSNSMSAPSCMLDDTSRTRNKAPDELVRSSTLSTLGNLEVGVNRDPVGISRYSGEILGSGGQAAAVDQIAKIDDTEAKTDGKESKPGAPKKPKPSLLRKKRTTSAAPLGSLENI